MLKAILTVSLLASFSASALADETTYRRVGVVPVVERYEATLALDASSELVGGTWTGDAPNGPANVVFVASEPVVRDLARASTDAAAKVPTIDLRRRTE